ncbi:DUF5696 domain-containing protein [Paenibacillus sp. XY044]|uniref:DUF5696 domain-containing protein n=1 Tax=Paenibacillus sp. XY044 TaxID=2026089 RepID=UPI000B97F15E|nr:DUF5696 domain-containing protein [Paenibacillus sp. XY044]OZB90684.1 hypothetical protein CJP46_31705 [Paenibacillus sp. XY044]
MLLLLVFKPWEQTTAERFSHTGIDAALPTPDALYEGDPWKPAAGVDGYALALENERYALYVRPDNTQIAVLDKASGYRWTSNPTKEELAGETVKGQLLANLQSPFLLTHVRTQGTDQTVRETLSNQTAGMQRVMIRQPQGLQIEYSFSAKQLGFVMQYELTDSGLRVKVPAAGIWEEGPFALFSLDVLPYFGAAKGDGYVFVPDGPGGLIRFDQEHASLTRGYSHQVYGNEVTNEENWTRTGERREDIAYPVFGLKKGDHAFLAVMTKGEDSANVSAMAPGLKSSFYQVFSSQIYREEYLYRMSRLAAPSKAVQKERLNRDREVEYRFLNGADADYVGMAGAYRSYLQETGRLTEALKPVDHVPLYLKIMGGNYEKAFGRIRYVAATTFEQAGDIVSTLQSKGVASLRTIFYGWQNEGDYNMEKRFPIDPALGGESAAKTFVSGMKERGVPVSFSEDFLWVDGHSSFSGKTDAIRGIDGTAYVDEGWYIAKPAYTAVTAADTVNRLKKLGVDGIHFSGIGEMLLNDYEPSGIQTREYAKTVYDGLLKYTREALGSASVNQGDAYALGQTDYIDGLPSESSYDFMIDETVPFYPIVLHGFVPYTFGDGNLRDDEDAEFLRAIEYGALPSFFVTHDDSRKLKDTPSNFLYSSRFDKWERRIEEEYAKFDSLSQLYSMRIIGHEKLSGQKYATTYEDGTRVVVDYEAKDFTVEKGAGK